MRLSALLSAWLVLGLLLGASAAVVAKDDDGGKGGKDGDGDDGRGRGGGDEAGDRGGEGDDDGDDRDDGKEGKDGEDDDRDEQRKHGSDGGSGAKDEARSAAKAAGRPLGVKMMSAPGRLVVTIVASGTGNGLAAELPDVGSAWRIDDAGACKAEDRRLTCPAGDAGLVTASAAVEDAPGWAAEATVRVGEATAVASAGLLLL